MDTEKIFDENKKLVGYIVIKHFKSFMKEYGEDLFQHGYILLYESILNFNPDKGKFSPFAYKRIYWGLNDYLDVNLRGFKKTCRTENGVTERYILKPTFVSLDKPYSETDDDKSNDLYNNIEISDNEFDDIEGSILYWDIIAYLEKIEKSRGNAKSKRNRYNGITEIFKLMCIEGTTAKDISNHIRLKESAIIRRKNLVRELVRDYLNDNGGWGYK